ncbi:hypothetical protein [Fictibacillus enclensis]|uniref:hypothetical protein n=1 Tax=Fictibacillus enclensis TaxID=1017270 RepID=UPI0025A23662|nr:hypothetical protein [Fictibacillus enclensis]
MFKAGWDNTGSVKKTNNRLNYDKQRHFALRGIIFENEDDKEIMKVKYIVLKKAINIDGELKGNSLLLESIMIFYFVLLMKFWMTHILK